MCLWENNEGWAPKPVTSCSFLVLFCYIELVLSMWEVSLFPTASRPTLGPIQPHGWMGSCNGISPLVGFLWLLMQHILNFVSSIVNFSAATGNVDQWRMLCVCGQYLISVTAAFQPFVAGNLWSWCEASVLYKTGNVSVSCRMKTFSGIGCSADHLACEPFCQSMEHVYNAGRLCCCCWWWWRWRWCVIELHAQLTLSIFVVWLWKLGILEVASGSFVRWK